MQVASACLGRRMVPNHRVLALRGQPPCGYPGKRSSEEAPAYAPVFCPCSDVGSTKLEAESVWLLLCLFAWLRLDLLCRWLPAGFDFDVWLMELLTAGDQVSQRSNRSPSLNFALLQWRDASQVLGCCFLGLCPFPARAAIQGQLSRNSCGLPAGFSWCCLEGSPGVAWLGLPS